MTRIGVQISTSTAPAQTVNPFQTATAFMIGYGDSGPNGTAVQCLSIGQVGNVIGARSATNQTLYDSADIYFRERGATLWVSVIKGPAPVQGTLTLNDAGAKPTVVVTAKNSGTAANQYTVAVTNGSAATVTANTTTASTALAAISSFANIGVGTLVTGAGIPAATYIVSVNTAAQTAVLSAAATATATGVTVTPGTFTVSVVDGTSQFATETHGPYINTPALYADLTSAMVTFAQSAGTGFTVNSPVAVAATALTGGTDNRAAATITSAGNALAAFTAAQGPGQVSAPGITNTTLNGIWSALDVHANTFNRVAIKDTDDQQTAANLIAAVGSTYGAAATASWGVFQAGWVLAPGLAFGSTRLVPGSAVVSALCARVDQTGNPNTPAAGPNYPLVYCTGFSGASGTPLYLQADIDALNVAGINTWNTVLGVKQNYGFATPVPQATDQVGWRFSASRLRMAIVQNYQITSAPFTFAVLDGRGLTIGAFSARLGSQLVPLVKNGAISTLAPDGTQDQGFIVDTSPNTPATMGVGSLLANVSYRPSPFAQLITLQLIAVPTTTSLS